MINSLSMMIISCVFIVILLLYFLSKEHVNTLEMKLYKYLLIANFLGLLFEILCTITIQTLPHYHILTIIVNRLYLLYFVCFTTIFSIYTFLISKGKDEFGKIFSKIKKYIYLCIVLMSLLVMSLSIDFNYGNIAYSYGNAVNLIYVYSFLNIIFCIVTMLRYFKNIKKQKYIPLIIYMFGTGVVGFIQKINPEMTLSTTIDAIVLFIMYFTIENPDMKLLEEAHKSKEISDSANEEKTLFLYNMTQEIRSITSKIDDDADLILDSKDLEDTYDRARDIKANTSKFNNMTNEILDVSNIDSSTIKIYNSKYNIKNILKQVINVYGNLCKDKELKFITNIDHDIPEVLYGDSIGLKEVLNTVLSNSVKYTSKGYVELSVNTIIKNDICRLIITIEDSGIGIRSEDINKIKVDNKSLAKANKTITMMNGTMLISSDYGIGTKIKLILDQKIEIEENTEVAKYESVFDDIDILCVDDSEAGLKIIDKLLKGTNIKIDKAETGKECLDKIKVNKYDLVLLDEELSQITGIELMGKIKEIRNFKTPVILLTKDNSYEYNEEYIKIGFSNYLLKPIKKEELINKINEYTKKK